MLVCAHPPSRRAFAPLMLQSVLGSRPPRSPPPRSNRRRWRSGWCGPRNVSATPASRLYCRARRLAERLPAVLEAVYGAYAIDWQLAPQGAPIESLSAEALHLALVLAELLPDEPEVLGLAALVCLSEARGPARRTADGGFIPLDEQDTKLWDEVLMARGEALLRRATAGAGRADSSTRRRSRSSHQGYAGQSGRECAEKAAPRPVAGGTVPRGGGGLGGRRRRDRRARRGASRAGRNR